VGAPPEPELTIVHAENLAWLRTQPDCGYDLIYADPPFNTGQSRTLRRMRAERVEEGGDRTGFAGRRYRTHVVSELAYDDAFDDYTAFLAPRLAEARRVLAPDGSLFVHVDPRESHYVKVLLDGLFGREAFLNEIVWAYDFGGRSKRRWPSKHDVILWYVKDPRRYTFRYDAIDRIPYLAPGLAGADKAARGKTPTDVWWQTIVPTSGRERTGYPTQKPLAILDRIVRVHSNPGGRVLDVFAGSGTTGEAAWRNGRHSVLVDQHPDAIATMIRRLGHAHPRVIRTGENDETASAQ
jgi:site-specific DNA-methyltransferase (adenine-specific)